MVRNLGSNLRGRLRNTDLPVSKCLFPLFEAVVNSIYAIDDRIASVDSFASTEGKIRVTLNRSSDSDLFGGKAELSTITIEDNGIGFDDNNYNSFCELDSMYRANRGCKGIGRLLWLKCFASVEIESFYKSVEGTTKNRHFVFTPDGITDLPETSTEEKCIGTKIILKGPTNAYKKAISKYGQETIAKSLFEHCLWFFLREGSCPDIKIIDGCDVTNLSEIYDSYLYDNDNNHVSFQIAGGTFVLITGASKGIGAEIARTLAKEGYNVAINFNKSESAAVALKNELEKYTSVMLVKADVSKYDEVASMVSAVRNKFGSITHLVCNAGISVTGLLEDMDLCQCDSVIDTNLKGVIYTVKEVIPDMVKRKSGVIVNVSSIWGKTGASCEAVYSASKAGVIAFSEAMAKELGLSGIRVNAVCPGCIDTDMMRKENFTACEMQTLIDETAIGRIGTPKDVADVVSFLLSDKSSFITGQAITVDGGFI